MTYCVTVTQECGGASSTRSTQGRRGAGDAHGRCQAGNVQGCLSDGGGFNGLALLQVSLRKRIEELRTQQIRRLATPRNELASDKSKDNIIAALKLRIKTLEDKNRELNQQLEVAYGQLYSLKL